MGSHYAKIISCDMANGIGIRVSIFFSGCNFHCKNCFNKELWDFNYGIPYIPVCVEPTIVRLLEPDYIKGLSILGGEPFQNINSLYTLVYTVIEYTTNKDIWIWTGYEMDELQNMTDNWKVKYILEHVDYLVTGRYEDDKRDLTLRFRGSSNQKIWHRNNGKWEIYEE